MELYEDQEKALEKAKKHNVFILTGPPGTGKTTMIKKIIEHHESFGRDIKLAGPTGKSAKRMIEQTGQDASTVHRLLEAKKGSDGDFYFSRKADNPIEADVIILDEVSMMSIPLMYDFLQAVSPGTKLIMVGDTYQLPPVGAGYVLRDMIDSGVIPFEELTIIKRQDPGLIITNCHHIKNGEELEINNVDSDFVLLHNDDAKDIQRVITKVIMEILPEKLPGINIFKEVQVISPVRDKTELSCLPLNKLLQEKLNFPNPRVKKSEFKVGDKVINVRNDYEKGIINGDIGYIKSIDEKKIRMVIDFESPDREVKLHLWDNDIQLAYAITCHKYQGSECRVIIIPVHSCFAPIIMQRNWLYTAISRARELCIVIGQESVVSKMIQRNKSSARHTSLTDFLQKGV